MNAETIAQITEYLTGAGGSAQLGNLTAEFRGLKKAQLVGYFKLDLTGNHQTTVSLPEQDLQ